MLARENSYFGIFYIVDCPDLLYCAGYYSLTIGNGKRVNCRHFSKFLGVTLHFLHILSLYRKSKM